MNAPRTTARLDTWLWQARFFRSRGRAADEIGAGHVRINGLRSLKPAHGVGVGDTLTFPQGEAIRVVRIVALAARRGARDRGAPAVPRGRGRPRRTSFVA